MLVGSKCKILELSSQLAIGPLDWVTYFKNQNYQMSKHENVCKLAQSNSINVQCELLILCVPCRLPSISEILIILYIFTLFRKCDYQHIRTDSKVTSRVHFITLSGDHFSQLVSVYVYKTQRFFYPKWIDARKSLDLLFLISLLLFYLLNSLNYSNIWTFKEIANRKCKM